MVSRGGGELSRERGWVEVGGGVATVCLCICWWMEEVHFVVLGWGQQISSSRIRSSGRHASDAVLMEPGMENWGPSRCYALG